MDKENPLYHKVDGRGGMNAVIDFDGMNAFNAYESGMYRYKQRIADITGVSLRYSKDRETCDMKVYHPTETDVEGDTCSVAVYNLYNLRLDFTSGSTFYFTALLTGIQRHLAEPVKDEYDGYPYLPPNIVSDVLPLPVKITLWPNQEGDNDED